MRDLIFVMLMTVIMFISPPWSGLFRNQPRADDTVIFTPPVPPDALLLLDKSGSMNLDPGGNPWANYPNRRIDIAREILFDLLDDNDDRQIDEVDEQSLNIRMGYMRFWDSSDNDDGDPWKGNIRVLSGIGNTSFRDIWNHVDRVYNRGAEEDGLGGTPLAASLAEAKRYFSENVNPFDPAVTCRQKFLILMTDGEDTFACGGDGSENQPTMYRRRMLTVQEAKELHDFGIKVFVVGLGGDLSPLKNTLNWIAKYGGTDNPLEMNSGGPNTYDIAKYGSACDATDANANPENYPLSGYAFITADASQLKKAMEAIAKNIQGKSYSFTAPAVLTHRVMDKDIVYLSSFIPNNTAFWEGNLKAYQLNEDGSLPVDQDGNPLRSCLIWDASENLKAISPHFRKIYTYVDGALRSFSDENLTNADLDVLLSSDRQNLINHIRGIDAYDVDQDGDKTEMRESKLGDIFHSNAVIVGGPSPFFEDEGFSGNSGFYQVHKDRRRVIIVGANDGMLHAFDVASGNEQWAFIPNGLLKNLKWISSAHTFYVDSSPKVADVWFNSSPTDITKSADEWKTLLICGLRKGGKTYFALDITDTLSPQYLWEFPKPIDTVTLGKVGQSWSEPAIGRVKVEVGGELYERWVAFIGGGFDTTNNLGKVFFVIDIKSGDIIKEFFGTEGMDYSFAAPPAAVDTNLDGFIDKIYIGDLGGQMWVFDLSFDERNKKSNSEWREKRLFVAPSSDTGRHCIYYQPAVAFDQYGTPIVYFGTGDRERPNDLSNSAERFYAVKDNGIGNYPRREIDLADVTSSNTFSLASKDGWYLRLEKSTQKSEKVLAKPVVFNKVVYFTTYTYSAVANSCSTVDEGRLYLVEYLSGAGAFELKDLSALERSSSQRLKTIGTGVPSNPVITVDGKGKASVTIGTTSDHFFSAQIFSPSKSKEILYWREVIR
jgi:type IV pilus assembly protein PilY1